MKKILFLFFALLLIGSESWTQNVAINNDGSAPDVSAILDIKSSSKGLLVPRVELASTVDIETIASPQTSLLVYNTVVAGAGETAVAPGFYYWNGSAWSRLGATAGAALPTWNLGGNAGTTPGADFIGTTDNKSLSFKVNNEPSGVMDIVNINTFFGYRAGKSITSGWGSIGIGQNALMNTTSGVDNLAIGESALGTNITGSGNMAIGKFALANSTASNNIAIGLNSMNLLTTGIENTAVGHSNQFSNLTGVGNTSMGYNALTFNTGSSNTALGRTALHNTSTGSENTGVGRSALFNNSTGSQNTAVGRNALNNNTTGNLNTAIGFTAEVGNPNLSNATVIGAKALANCSNCVVIGSVNGINGASSDVNVGIGNINPAHPLSFKSALGAKISLWNGGGAYHYGIGVQSSLMQIYTDNIVADIGFGFGNSTEFTERMRIKGNGNVGINTTTPSHQLEIAGNSDMNKVQLSLHESQDDFARMRFSSSLNNNFWDVAGKNGVDNANSYANFYYSGLGMDVLSLRGNGNAVLAGVLTQNSDLRFKKDLMPITGALDKIRRLNGYHYYWKDGQRDNSIQTGVIAQEVQQIMPELVTKDENQYLSVNYSGLIPVLIEAIKEQQQQIIELKKQNGELTKIKGDIEELKKGTGK